VNSSEVRRQWAERTGAYSPEYYAHYGPNETSERVRATLVDRVGRDASVLELGCNIGRHLEHLRDDGFDSLAGVDVNDHAFDVMAETYPALAESGQFHVGTFADVLPEFDDGAFDAVYSVETLQHVPPEGTDVFAEVARVTGSVLVTVENEGGPNDRGANGRDGSVDRAAGEDAGEDVNYVDDGLPLYYRDWGAVFGDLGMVERERATTTRDTMRVFEWE
jgi:SAM-dependent methyltransferase